ncbi:MAG: type II secretion system F family protein [archaeon]
MNTLKFYPKPLREKYRKNIRNAGILKSPESYHNSLFIISLAISIASSVLFSFIGVNMLFSLLVFVIVTIFFYFQVSLKASARIKKMETVFPDVISLMASNLRSGITIDRAFLLAARPEFDPLDKEILKTGKEIATGKDVLYALKIMAEKVDSEKISKIVMLIISSLKAGGKISNLLEETAKNMKEKEMIEKKTSSVILMYVIFIFFAVAIGAPVLFGLGTVLVEVVMSLTAKIPDTASMAAMNIPLTFSEVSVPLNFVIYFSLSFIIVSDFISCLVIGLVNKGEGKAGLKLFFPIVAISVTVFFVIRTVLSKILLEIISGY